MNRAECWLFLSLCAVAVPEHAALCLIYRDIVLNYLFSWQKHASYKKEVGPQRNPLIYTCIYNTKRERKKVCIKKMQINWFEEKERSQVLQISLLWPHGLNPRLFSIKRHEISAVQKSQCMFTTGKTQGEWK